VVFIDLEHGLLPQNLMRFLMEDLIQSVVDEFPQAEARQQLWDLLNSALGHCVIPG
jgi:hypothetical protein